MKRFCALLLSLWALLTVAAPAEDADWELYESPAGYSFFYDANQFYLDDGLPDGKVAVYPQALYAPLTEEDESGRSYTWIDVTDQAALVFSPPREPADPDWVPPSVFQPLGEAVDFALPCWRARRVIQDETMGPYVSEDLVISAAEGLYLFSLSYPQGDPNGWGERLWEIVTTLEFPPQPAVAGSFCLTYDRAGDEPRAIVVLDEEAQPMTLTIRAAVTDFSLEKLTWDEDTVSIVSSVPLLTADALAPGDSICISAYVPEILPDLYIACVNAAGESEWWYVAQSGRDGSLLLLPEDGV
ncbi:MAG: hypothetical protein IJ662_10415 [Clostridia bacterium]|nr:hypothetical protein [Clostridia bacterium]